VTIGSSLQPPHVIDKVLKLYWDDALETRKVCGSGIILPRSEGFRKVYRKAANYRRPSSFVPSSSGLRVQRFKLSG